MQKGYIFKGLLFTAFATIISGGVRAQFNLKKQIPEKDKLDTNIVDDTYGIVIYEPLNMVLAGDSVRMCGNYACQNWVEDYYVTDVLAHKGFYLDGQLKAYKNFYPNGTMERDFRAIDNYRSTTKLYFPNGNLKSEIKHNEGVIESWDDYNEEGKLTYSEKLIKGKSELEYKKFFYKDGTPEKLMVLEDKKKLIYTYTEYYPDGKLKVEGKKIYDPNKMDYVENGPFKYYDQNGSVEKTVTYKNGEKLVK